MKFVDFVEDEKLYYIVTELAHGGTLEDYINYKKRQPLSQNDIIDIFYALVKAVEYLNKQGLIHRDINPKNIFFRKFGEDVMLGDLGCAKYKK
jgi:serine/threonine protein kinase